MEQRQIITLVGSYNPNGVPAPDILEEMVKKDEEYQQLAESSKQEILKRIRSKNPMDNCKCKLNSCFNQEHLSIA